MIILGVNDQSDVFCNLVWFVTLGFGISVTCYCVCVLVVRKMFCVIVHYIMNINI
jgi:hypothetical protein